MERWSGRRRRRRSVPVAVGGSLMVVFRREVAGVLLVFPAPLVLVIGAELILDDDGRFGHLFQIHVLLSYANI